MTLFAVTTQRIGKDGHYVWYPFDHPARNIDELFATFVRDRMLLGTRYSINYRDGRKLTDPRRVIINPGDFSMIQTSKDRV